VYGGWYQTSKGAKEEWTNDIIEYDTEPQLYMSYSTGDDGEPIEQPSQNNSSVLVVPSGGRHGSDSFGNSWYESSNYNWYSNSDFTEWWGVDDFGTDWWHSTLG
jgi:hypothetical protein